MNIIDSHTHLGFVKPEKSIKEHIDNMEISGACVFSPPPIEYDSELGMDFDARLDRVIGFTSEYKDILFPIIWIHPYEEDIFKNKNKWRKNLKYNNLWDQFYQKPASLFSFTAVFFGTVKTRQNTTVRQIGKH